MHFNLGKQTLFYFSFDSSEHKRPDDFMQLFDYIIILFSFVFFAHFGVIFVAKVKPLVEVF
jgi:hypothetical protein